MVHSRVVGVRTAWRVVGDGDFFCAACGGDRCYRQLAGRLRLTVLGVPLLPRGSAGPVVECASCRGRFPLDALSAPTTTRLGGLLREAVHAVAVAMLCAAGDDRGAARAAAAESVRAAGFGDCPGVCPDDCVAERLETLLAAAGGSAVAALRETVGALSPHLAGPGRESLLLAAARIALADGPYDAAERETLAALGDALSLPPADTGRLLAAAAA